MRFGRWIVRDALVTAGVIGLSPEIKIVLLPCAEPQITRPVVCWIAVDMVNFVLTRISPVVQSPSQSMICVGAFANRRIAITTTTPSAGNRTRLDSIGAWALPDQLSVASQGKQVTEFLDRRQGFTISHQLIPGELVTS